MSVAPAPNPRQTVAVLTFLSLTSYVVRSNIAVAGKLLMPEFGLDTVRMGQVFAAFMLGYALFQAPCGLLGDHFGTRGGLAAAAAAWAGLTALTAALAPTAFVALLATRFLLGVAVAAMYPLAGRAIADRVPARRRSFANALVVAGLAAGSALTPPLVSFLMLRIGWRATFHLLALLPLAGAVLWWQVAPAGSRPDVDGGPRPVERWPQPGALALLSAAYFLESYIQYIFLFWFYLYLVDVRAFPLAQGGLLAALPYLLALASMPLAGWVSDRWSVRNGPAVGRARLALLLLVAAGLLLAAGTAATDPRLAVAAIAVSVALVLATEGPFWATAAALAPAAAGTAGGVMNTAGNLAGVASTALVPVLAQRFGWPAVFYSTALLSGCAGLLWCFIRIPAPAVCIGGEVS